MMRETSGPSRISAIASGCEMCAVYTTSRTCSRIRMSDFMFATLRRSQEEKDSGVPTLRNRESRLTALRYLIIKRGRNIECGCRNFAPSSRKPIG